MSTRRSSTAPRAQVVSPVCYDTAAAAPLGLKYPDGKLMLTIPAHLPFVLQAARETDTRVFVVNGARLLVYYTRDGQTSCVPTHDPISFFEAFRRLQTRSVISSASRDTNG